MRSRENTDGDRRRSKKLIETDGEVNLQYYLFRFHHIRPIEFLSMGKNERKILYSFIRYEIEQRVKENTPPDEWEE